jgi:hypothetical protein
VPRQMTFQDAEACATLMGAAQSDMVVAWSSSSCRQFMNKSMWVVHKPLQAIRACDQTANNRSCTDQCYTEEPPRASLSPFYNFSYGH